MTDFARMEAEVNTFLKTKTNLVTMLKQALNLRDEFPLESRWALFLKSEQLLPISSDVTNSMDILSDTLYDDFNTERHQTRMFSEIDECILEGHEYACTDIENGEAETIYEKELEMYAKRDTWREAVLAEGYAGFVYDW